MKPQNSVPKFSQEFRQQVRQQMTPLLDEFEKLSLNLADRNLGEAIWQPPDNLQDLLDHYLDTLLVV